MSNFFEWIDSYSVGVEELDEEHKKMVLLANAMIIAVNERKGHEIAGSILVELIDTITEHFKNEEFLLEKTKYPDFEEHKSHHNRIVHEVFDFNEQYRKGDLDIVNISNFLIDLIITHINVVDKKYMEHLSSHGIQ